MNFVQLAVIAEASDGDSSRNNCFNYKQQSWEATIPLDTIQLLLENAAQFIGIKASNGTHRAQLVCSLPAKYVKSPTADLVLKTLFLNTSSQRQEPSMHGASCVQLKLEKRYMTTQLYDALYERHLEELAELPELRLPTCFKPVLRRYQRLTVHWLQKREHVTRQVRAFYSRLTPSTPSQQMCSIYKHNYCEQLLPHMPSDIVLPPGGILADEMGLGKTVEMLALILLHPCTSMLGPLSPLPMALKTDDQSDVPQKKMRRVESKLFCFCHKRGSRRNLIECTRCKLQQHAACVTRYNCDHSEEINDPYICPGCWAKCMEGRAASTLPTRATFIVSPKSIKSQWLDEIQRHVENPPLRVLCYDGVMTGGKWISPRQLADYDVVLCDYNILRSEVYHTAEYESSRVTRHKPLFMRLSTPLMMLTWWRVCLDEAQMVESNTSKIAALLRMLPAVNRWAVTGTPIQRSLDDLVPLLRFIGFEEACKPVRVWHTLINEFVQRHGQVQASQLDLIDKVLWHCMWRTCKSKVIDELGIPPQRFAVHHIQLSDLEKLFYTDMHKECEDTFRAALAKYVQNAEESVRTISPQTLNLILKPLIKLRQSCNIPVVLNSKQSNGLIVDKQFMQPEQLHAHLKAANILACKSELRSIASSYNGIAANHFLRGNHNEAIRFYQLVLKLANDYKDTPYYVDSVLQIHALHNMLQAYYSSNVSKSGETIESYATQCSVLEAKYLEPYATQLAHVKNGFDDAWNSHITFSSEIEISELFAKALTYIERNEISLQDALMLRVYDECKTMFADKPTIDALQSVRGILYVIDTWYRNTTKAISDLKKKLEQLEFFTENVGARNQVDTGMWRQMMQFVNSVYDCHLSEIRKKSKASDAQPKHKSKSKKKYCELCKINQDISQLECLLFRKTIDEQTNAIEGIASPSAEMTLIKSVYSCLRSRPFVQSLHLNIDKQLELLNNMQTLFKRLTKFWIEIEYTVKAYDELDMCKMRMSLRAEVHSSDDDDEDDNELDGNWQIRESELCSNLMQQEMNLKQAEFQFSKKLARLKYIMHLEKRTDPGPCPICTTEDDIRYVVLECGHHICLTCLKVYAQSRSTYLSCAICRNEQSTHNLYYVTRCSNKAVEEDIDVKGNFSTKIMSIIRLVLRLKRDYDNKECEDEPKILIFSQWQPILNAIGKALTANDVTHCLRWSTQTIEEFKNPNLGITCLLMSLSNGSKGLNLIEANTVILVEPILNPGEELQAIGRVHRFGQTKTTTVHRFIVDGTIEETVFNTISKDASKLSNWDFDNMTLANLRDLFKLQNNFNV